MEDLDSLLAEEELLQFTTFSNEDALALGAMMVEAARTAALPIAIDVRRGDQQLFHAAMPGATADNDAWIERKIRVVRRFGRSSFAVGTALRLDGRTIEDTYLLPESEYAPHGGAFPVTVKDVGVVGTVAVSGLPQEDDHAFVVGVLRKFLGR
ncbi:MAG TPA: heme-degrading domain-containing protein [Gaiellaceae bacterium]|nr:heme-degrading domain-containing protein [Gaiellaceae bacterium]